MTAAKNALSGQRLPAEWQYQTELKALGKHDQAPKPKGWQLSPQAVRTFILGSGSEKIGRQRISRKIFGNDVVVERAIVTLAGQRGLMLVGEPEKRARGGFWVVALLACSAVWAGALVWWLVG